MRLFSFVLLFIITVFTVTADLPDAPVLFPEDDYGHHDDTRYYPQGMYAEWWYFNGEITGTSYRGERHFAFFISFHFHKFPYFPEDVKQVLAGITDLDRNKYYFMQLANFNEELAMDIVDTESLHIEYESAESRDNARLKGFYLDPCNPDKATMKLDSRLTTDEGDVIRLDLLLHPLLDPLLVNGGKIDMPGSFYGIPNGESVYIAKTKLLLCGKLKLGHETVLINPLRSEGWFDHQYGDFLSSDTSGWEWFSLRLDTEWPRGYDLYGDIFCFVDKVTKDLIYGYASFLLPGGEIRHINFDSTLEFEKSNLLTTPLNYVFPLKHNIYFPDPGLSLEITSSVQDQYAENMYEGHCDVNAVYMGEDVTGFAFKELVY